MPLPEIIRLIKKPEALKLTATSHSTFHLRIKDGILPPPVILGENSVAYPLHEIDAINRARLAGKSNDEIRELVADLVKQRKEATL
ncbi:MULTISPECIES: helix-turn-helix transcriptional regulator [Methylotenera]|uniref:helix-turn-helix transcriptional regulator n=1 Tax=Methylotenera TaxID=359407 RepID=UPI0003754759|nr:MULTISPECIES: AlpA family phage regulatory protein [Methylotenera]